MKRDFTQLAGRHFDVLVCGGGIYGAWTAYDAALRGLKVAIVDQGDWASGTSSASSKLIHGGLRYLETLDFKLVKKALREREMLKKAAPHRVWPLRFGIPLCKNSRLNAIRLKLGLLLYDLLAETLFSDQAHRYWHRAAFAQRFPCLDPDLLTGGFSYADAQTDDARLVLELIDGALSAGAVCLNYCKVNGLIEQEGRVIGAEIQDRIADRTAAVYARRIVKTTGQWTHQTGCRLTKGVHLILPKALEDEALLLTAETDGRVFFMIPWYGLTLLGTTDTDYSGDIDHVRVEPEDAAYLLVEASRVLKTEWSEADIIGRFAGLRVLKQSLATAPSDLSRDWELKAAENGVLTSIGGKITSAREDAAHIVDTLCNSLGIDASCRTNGRPFPWLPEQDYRQWSDTAKATAAGLGIDHESAQWLLRRHGKRVSAIFQSIERDSSLAERMTPTLPFIKADLLFCAGNEMVVHLDDLLRRRLPLLILAKMTESELRDIAGIVAPIMAWDQRAVNSEVQRCVEKYL
jgi:glycerol-3-phosphate dehydrogenase